MLACLLVPTGNGLSPDARRKGRRECSANTSPNCVAWVLHGGIGGDRKGLESLGNVLWRVATQKARRGALCFFLNL